MTRTYGPHDRSTAPQTVTVGAGSNEHPAPLHPALVKQREVINQLAAGKTTVLAAVNDAAPDAVKARIDAAILTVAARGGVFSANDVRPLLDGISGGVVGARFNAAARRGVIKRVGYVPSTKGNTHSHPIAEWSAA